MIERVIQTIDQSGQGIDEGPRPFRIPNRLPSLFYPLSKWQSLDILGFAIGDLVDTSGDDVDVQDAGLADVLIRKIALRRDKSVRGVSFIDRPDDGFCQRIADAIVGVRLDFVADDFNIDQLKSGNPDLAQRKAGLLIDATDIRLSVMRRENQSRASLHGDLVRRRRDRSRSQRLD